MIFWQLPLLFLACGVMMIIGPEVERIAEREEFEIDGDGVFVA